MREELEAVLELYEGMPPVGQEHWRERSLPCVEFQSESEREEFLAALHERNKLPMGSASAAGSEVAAPAPGARTFSPGDRVKVNLAGIVSRGVQFSQNCEAVYAVVQSRVSEDPAVYHVKLLFSFRGVEEADVPAERMRPM